MRNVLGFTLFLPYTLIAVAIALIFVLVFLGRYHDDQGKKIQFGILELLALPIALAPYVAFALNPGIGSPSVLPVIYGLSGAAIGWSLSLTPTGGWKPAIGIIAGAWGIAFVGVMVLYAVFVVAILSKNNKRDEQGQ